MKKINQVFWVLLAGLSFLVGTWVLITEGPVHSKFYVFYIFCILCGAGFLLKRKTLLKNTKPKKRL